MDPAAKRVIGMTLVIIIATMGLIIWYNSRFGNEMIVSQIDGFDYHIDQVNGNVMNVTFLFEATVENYGTVRDVSIPCSSIQNYLVVKNSTVPVLTNFVSFDNTSSYILNSTHITDTCDDQPSVVTVSESVLDHLAVAIPFRMISGTYSFTWFNSVADVFYAVVVHINVPQGEAGINYQLEADTTAS